MKFTKMAGLPGIRYVILGGRILTEQNVKIEEIDLEWMQLIMEAKNLGLQKEEIREFLHNNRTKEVLIKA